MKNIITFILYIGIFSFSTWAGIAFHFKDIYLEVMCIGGTLFCLIGLLGHFLIKQ